MDKQVFIEAVGSIVRELAPMYGITVYSPIIAQACLESDYGRSYKAKYNNFHGLKYREGRVSCHIGTFVDGGSEQNADGSYENITDQWYSFASMEDGIRGYFEFINIPRYSSVKGVSDPLVYLELLKSAGYATSLNYVRNVYNTLVTNNLQKFDTPIEAPKPTKSAKVCIDAGHVGKYNRSPGVPEYYESEVMWKLSQLQAKYFEQAGIEVVHTRQHINEDKSLFNRGYASLGCDLFISNHTNAVGSGMNESVDYPVVYHLVEDVYVIADDISKKIAIHLAPAIASTMGTKQAGKIATRLASSDRNNDGIMNDNYYGVLHGARTARVPGIIIEHSFHTNTRITRWLLNDTNLDALARADVEAIAEQLLGSKIDLSKPLPTPSAPPVTPTQPKPTPPSTTPDTLLTVQVGAYKSRANADARVNALKRAGYSAFVKEDGDFYKVQCGAFSYKENADRRVAELRARGFESFIVFTNRNSQ